MIDPIEARALHFAKHCERVERSLRNVEAVIRASEFFPTMVWSGKNGVDHGKEKEVREALRRLGWKLSKYDFNGGAGCYHVSPIDDEKEQRESREFNEKLMRDLRKLGKKMERKRDDDDAGN